MKTIEMKTKDKIRKSVIGRNQDEIIKGVIGGVVGGLLGTGFVLALIYSHII